MSINDFINIILQDCSSIDFRGLPQVQYLFSLNITDIFIPTRIAIYDPPIYKTKYSILDLTSNYLNHFSLNNTDERESIQLIDFAIREKIKVILGDPGSGKTTLLKYLAYKLGINFNSNDIDGVLPIIFPLRSFAETIKRNDSISLIDQIKRYYQTERGWQIQFDNWFEKFLIHGNVHFLFDGLDEVVDENMRRIVVGGLEDLIVKYPDCFYTITSRIAGYERVPIDYQFPHGVILPLNDDEKRCFSEKWETACKELMLSKSTCHSISKYKSEGLFNLVTKNSSISSITSNILLLTMIALIYIQNGGFPERRVDIYKKCILILAETWNRWRSISHRPVEYGSGITSLNEDFIIRTLGPIAYWFTENNPGGLIEKKELINRIKNTLYEDKYSIDQIGRVVDEYFEIVNYGTGLITEKGLCLYGFLHRTFEEYLSARVLSDLKRENDVLEWFDSNIDNPKWREVIIFTIGACSINLANLILDHIIVDSLNNDPVNVDRLLLIGECLLSRGISSIQGDTWNCILSKLYQVMQNNQISNTKRRLAGLIINDMDWEPNELEIFIPINNEKEFRFGKDNQIKKVPNPYSISRYPITNNQFSRFIDADGYNKETLWTDTGWQWRTGDLDKNVPFNSWTQYLRIRPIEKRDSPYYWYDPNFYSKNCPVVGVTFYEAEAYCKWLTIEFKNENIISQNEEFRLPDDLSWEYAARGEDGRQYPWVGSFNKSYANNATQYGQGIGTTNIDMFPDGISPHGLWDCAGNVWELTSTLNKDSSQVIIKGGGWKKYYWFSKCYHRSLICPPGFSNDIGFRIMLIKGK